jgi:glutamate formiminotransferase
VAYNVWLAGAGLGAAQAIARSLRGPAVRALGLQVGPGAGDMQVSMNLVDPASFGPAEAYDAVRAQAPVARAELVGLVPRSVLEATPRGRWAELDLAEDRTIEARAEALGLR